MARNKKGHKSKDIDYSNYEQVDTYYIPKDLSKRYIALRQAIIADAKSWFIEVGMDFKLEQPEKDEPHQINGYKDGELIFCLKLTPDNITQGQKARDKLQIAKFFENYYLNSN